MPAATAVPLSATKSAISATTSAGLRCLRIIIPSPFAAPPPGSAGRGAECVDDGEVALDLPDQRLDVDGLVHAATVGGAAHAALIRRSSRLYSAVVRGATNGRVEIRLLGPLQLVRGDSVVPLPRRQQRALLAVLALHAGEVVSTDRLIEDLWGSDAPRSALGSLQNAVSSLRKVVGSDALLTEPPGYRLALEPEAVDALRFERLVEEARAAPAGMRGALLAEALALWRGPALDDLAFEPFAGAEIARLEGLRLDAEEERLAGELGLGRHDHLVPELEALVAENPLRDRLRGQLMLALYRSGRHAEALEVYRAARLALADELGLDPSPELQRLERAILRHDPALEVREEPATELPAAPRERRVISVLAAAPPALDDPELLLGFTGDAAGADPLDPPAQWRHAGAFRP